MAARPALVAHADWSSAPARRAVAVAERHRTGYVLVELVRAPDPAALVARVVEARGVLGLDLPLGLPLHYARRAGIRSFPAWLDGLGAPPWHRIATPASRPEEIGIHRPFYPARPGGARRAHLVDALAATSFDDLRRRCERAPPLRRPASPVFWTLGANQVGRAALAGWPDLARPARSAGAALWPFEGDLGDLVAAGQPVVTETYPAAASTALGAAFGPRQSKRRQPDRADRAPALLAAASRLGVAVPPAWAGAIRTGIDPSLGGDDAFDALAGLLGLLGSLGGDLPADAPATAAVRHIEGWITGLHA